MKLMDKSNGVNGPKSKHGSVASAKPESPKGKRRRIRDGLIGLSSAAILSVYGLGYLNTNAAENQLLAQEVNRAAPRSFSTPAPNTGPRSSGRSENDAGQRSSGRSAPAPTPIPPGRNQTQQATTYKDGTFVGVGTSRHGNIEATVVIKDGKISSASITRCMTRYPCSDVSVLVREVVDIQSIPVDHVSRATDSSNAYKQAITNALAKAS